MARSSGFLDTLLTSPTTERYRVGISLLFLLGVWLTVGSFSQGMPNSMLLMAAAVIGGYMAINIGANDVANNVGPAVGSGALSLGAAVLIAAVFEAGGAIIAGGDVVSTIKGGIIDPSNLEESRAFVWLMTAALLAGALWLNLATWMGAPVSTTHSIVGGDTGTQNAANNGMGCRHRRAHPGGQIQPEGASQEGGGHQPHERPALFQIGGINDATLDGGDHISAGDDRATGLENGCDEHSGTQGQGTRTHRWPHVVGNVIGANVDRHVPANHRGGHQQHTVGHSLAE